MENMQFRYIRTPYFVKYDETLNNSFLFEGELDKTKPIIESKVKRYVINATNLENSILINSLDIEKKDFGFLITICDETLILVNAGENIYYLACLANINNKTLFDVLKTFMVKENCYIDVTRFKHLFEDKEEITLYKNK